MVVNKQINNGSGFDFTVALASVLGNIIYIIDIIDI